MRQITVVGMSIDDHLTFERGKHPRPVPLDPVPKVYGECGMLSQPGDGALRDVKARSGLPGLRWEQRIMVRFSILLTYIATMLLSGVCWSASSGTYSVVEVGSSGGRSSSVARGINSSGHIAGRSGTLANSGTTGFVWNGAQANLSGVLPGGDFSEATGINDVDEVVGSSNGADRIRAVRWKNGSGVEDLGTLPGGVASQAFAINASGTAVGLSTGPLGTRAVAWTRQSGVTDLGTLPGGNFSKAMAINDGGVIAGIAKTPSGNTHAVVWTRGVIRDLGVVPPHIETEAFGINNSGEIVGSSSGSNVTRAVLWDRTGRVQDLGTLPGGEFSQALAINASGVVVGISTNDEHENRAFVWTSRGGMRDLNELIPEQADVLVVAAVGINARGQIVAFGGPRSSYSHDSPSRIYLLTPAN